MTAQSAGCPEAGSAAGLLVTGTDTGVGKTWVVSVLARHLVAQGHSVGVYKPAASGATVDANGRLRWSDVDALWAAVDGLFAHEVICPQRFAAPLAPPAAARQEGRCVDRQQLYDGTRWWNGRVELLFIEGVGGLLCPLTDEETVADFARDLRAPVLIVARRGLGTISHTLLTIEAARSRGLPLAGIVLNETQPAGDDRSVDSNADEIERRGGVTVLAEAGWGDPDGLLRDRIGRRIEWPALFAPLGEKNDDRGGLPHL